MAHIPHAWRVFRAQALLLLSLCFTITLLTLLAHNTAANAAQIDAAAVISIDPAAPSVTVGVTVGVDILVTSVANAYGADVRITYDPSLLQAIDANPSTPGTVELTLGPLLTQSSYFTVRNEANNTTGTAWVALVQLNPALPVNGTGVLAHINFQTLAAGVSPIIINSAEIADRNGMTVDTTTQNGTIGILPPGGSTATPSRTRTATATTAPPATSTATPSPTPSFTATSTATATATRTATKTPLNTPTQSATPTATLTPGGPPTATFTVTATLSATATASATGTPTETATPGAPSTSTSTPSITPTKTTIVLPSATLTHTTTATTTIAPLGPPTATRTRTATATQTMSGLWHKLFMPVIVVDADDVQPLVSPTPTETEVSWWPPLPTATPTSIPTQPTSPVSAPLPDANWVAVDPVNERVFVTSRSAGKVYALNGADLSLLGATTVGSLPFGIAVNPVNRLVYVANYGSGSVSLLSADTRQLLRTYVTGGGPTFVAVDTEAGYAYVPLHPSNQVARFQGGVYLGNFSVRGEQVFSIAIDTQASPKRLYIGTRTRSGDLLVYDVNVSPRYITTLSVGHFVYSMAVDSMTGNLYVVHSDANGDNARFLTVFDRSGHKLTGQPLDLGVNTLDGGGLGVVASSGHIYVAGTSCISSGGACAGYAPDGRVLVVDAASLSLSASLAQDIIPNGPFGVAVDETRQRVYVTSKGGGGWVSAINDSRLGGE